MRLKSIQIHGFKSFGEKTIINFNENLIAIVGPNGSGKSNIIDAVKWVFGEQKNKSLRTEKNIDVIFAGSENKKPMNYAEVSLIFDNSDNYLNIDYSEVEITRRLYKTGDNEYFLNKSKCRLKDITNLSIDKGFGKDSFSIISQGNVEEIIMSKPEKRREIIEEVAGILKYRSKKDTAQSKLNKTEDNLNKIEFIINEINNTLNPLELEKNKATSYLNLKKDFSAKEKNLLAVIIKDNSDKLDFEKIKLNDLKRKQTKYDQKIETIEKEFIKINTNINSIQENMSITTQKNLELKNEYLKKENIITLINEKNNSNIEVDDQNVIEKVKNKITNIDLAITEYKTSLYQIDTQNKQNKIEKDKYESELYFLSNNRIKILSDIRKIESSLSNIKNPYTVEKLIQKNFSGIIGTVEELFSIKAGYEIAIDNILGRRKYEIVVDDEKIAQTSIEYLKKEKLGKVSFLPLNKIKPKYIKNEIKNEIINNEYFLGFVDEFIEYDNKYEKIFSYLFGNVLVAKNIKDAYKLLKYNYTIITLDGEIISNVGKITGGYERNLNKYSLEHKLIELEIEISSLDKKISDIQKKEQEINQIYSNDKITYNLNEKYLEQALFEKQKLDIEFTKLNENFDNNDENEYTKLIKELNLIKDQILNLEKNNNTDKSNQEELIKNKKELEVDLIGKRSFFKELNLEVNQTNIEISKLESKISQDLDILREKYEISFNEAYLKSNKDIDIKKLQEEVRILKFKIRELGFVNINAIDEYKIQKEKFDFYNTQKIDITESKYKIEKSIQELDTYVNEKFTMAYHSLNEEFNNIFTHLFGGGQASLVLSNPNDISTTGVEIVAQPPGKKSQIIGLLSGGEKALTSISLLFAILRLRVVPYAILDEVEAALDEVNVVKYAKFIKIFSQNTQFIVITHRQGTMEYMDKLYGVTMPNRGISSIMEINVANKENNV